MYDEKRYSPDLDKASKDEVYYALTMFPYPSGSGLHCGHASVMTINDVHARWQRMLGKEVFQPFGFDAFGLPTENYAMKVGKPAYEVTEENKAMFIQQLQALNLSFDWTRMVDTSKPDYYKRTQRLFQQLYKAGLVYRDELRVNRCPDCQTVLANDQVVDGRCERCKNEVTQKKMPQWFIKITDYADRLLDQLDSIDRPEETKTAQRNRIGRSEGVEIDFEISGKSDEKVDEVGGKIITCFTTRPDTIYGVTAVVLAPENILLDDIMDEEHRAKVEEYRKMTLAKTSVERQQGTKEKTGVFSGTYVTHPLTGEDVPVWFADYVLSDYGSGAVMMVPAHDERDWAFAEKFGIDSRHVIAFHYESGNKPVPGKEVVERKNVLALVKHWKNDEYALLDRPEPVNFKTMIMGGVESGESYLDAAKREIVEEIGYDDFKFIKQIPGEIHAEYFAAHKDHNKYSKEQCFYFELQSDHIGNTNLDDENHDLKWISRDDVLDFLSDIPGDDSSHIEFWSRFQSGIGSYTGSGTLIHSGGFNGLTSQQAKEKIITHLEEMGTGRRKTTYKLRDWSVSRQRYWGSPIPVYYDEAGEPKLIPEEELPVVLPLDVANYKPKGKSPLEDHPTFPIYEKDGKSYKRECDTLDTFMCSSFYFLRYPDVANPDELIRKELADKMFPIDLYTGGKEHTVGHLLYARFIHTFLYDQGYVSSPEPVQKLVHQGMVLGADGRKMGKRYGNGVDPLEVIEKYGADAVRTYLMFMGPVEQDKTWNDNALHGVKKFLDRVERIFTMDRRGQEHTTVESMTHQTVQGITYDLEHLKLNTAVSKLMILVNTIYEHESVTTEQLEILTLLIAPFAPELAEKMWEWLGHTDDVHYASRPVADVSKIQQSSINLPIQINGKMRGKIDIESGLSEDEVVALATGIENIAKWLEGKEVKKVIWVQDKILNIITI